ncbi:VOC family protein [Corynebacterium sp. 153RC1]|uniref:VOC family protein n=1 Tax=unclassified Corynebacterium TaxID=2624378 RepID=UPI00211C80F3|nr:MULTISPECIES: VOC family protein [unclassified Corynebacterium]MCQ9352837.1 VOC family protein [Corynebacterium sp. 209RC1]MCQ9355229.1 VOC family protein [Corynebacterium sp. 1222RC1]MCQ9357416.1 VOC family protein [Corynebacterium sp. 122RC1]MCQ9359656.1 VOC family protein [Corynebacterium sp. 142RC1]MCQ9361670.1 VOC family protein [Corynebacterium sp. 153RC1]
MPAFQALPGMPYWVDLASSDLRKSTHFYAQVAGWEIEELGSGYHIARIQGLPVAGFVARPEEQPYPDTWATYFLTESMEATITEAEQAGGRVLAQPMEARLGRMALLVDAAGAIFGLIEPAGEEAFIAAGEPGTPVWHELTCTTANGYREAREFYPQVFGWMTSTMDSDTDFEYTTALAEGAPFAGIFNAAGQFPPQVPSFWQTYIGVANVDEAAQKAVELGGELIREPWDSPFGRMVLLADSTGATVVFCEVEPPVEEGRESDPLEGIDLTDFTAPS